MDKREFKGMAYTFCFLRGANYIPLFFAFNGRSLSDIFRGPSRELSAARCRQGAETAPVEKSWHILVAKASYNFNSINNSLLAIMSQ